MTGLVVAKVRNGPMKIRTGPIKKREIRRLRRDEVWEGKEWSNPQPPNGQRMLMVKTVMV
jgi:hypothetical protein